MKMTIRPGGTLESQLGGSDSRRRYNTRRNWIAPPATQTWRLLYIGALIAAYHILPALIWR